MGDYVLLSEAQPGQYVYDCPRCVCSSVIVAHSGFDRATSVCLKVEEEEEGGKRKRKSNDSE